MNVLGVKQTVLIPGERVNECIGCQTNGINRPGERVSECTEVSNKRY